MSRNAAFPFALLGALLVCCTPEAETENAGAAGDTTQPRASAPAAERPDSAAIQDTASRAVFGGPVTLARSGGLAGYDDQIVIHPDGRVETRRGATGIRSQITEETLRQLANALANAETLERQDTADVGADQLNYIVEYHGRRLEFATSTTDNRLRALRDVIELIFTR